MKQITFHAQPFSIQELTTTINDEDWARYESMLEHGEPIDTIFKEVWESHNFTIGKQTILPSYEAYDFEVADCDCKENKK